MTPANLDACTASPSSRSTRSFHREEGQSQFIEHAPSTADGASLAKLLDWMNENFDEDLTAEAIVRRAAMSVRNLNRRFREQTGVSPRKWLLRARVHRARRLLETSDLGVERVALEVGFRSSTGFREGKNADQLRGVRRRPPGAGSAARRPEHLDPWRRRQLRVGGAQGRDGR